MRLLPAGLMGMIVMLAACGSSTPPGSTSPAVANEPPPALAGTRPVPFADPYPSMEECVKVWALKRAEYDKLWGASQSDNGAAYWVTPAEKIELACNPTDSAAEMSLRYEPLAADQ